MKELEKYKGQALVCTSEEFQVSNELWQSLITVIEVKPDMFHNMGTTNKPVFYPKKELTNIIGCGMGIEFDKTVSMKEVYGEEKILPDGTRIRKVSGYQCTKIGKKRKPDGDFMFSSPFTYEFNWEDRAEEDFLSDMDNVGQFWPDKNPKAKYNFPDDPAKEAVARRKRVLALKKFAAQRASTGAELGVIRELTGMPTGFKPNELTGGKIVVSQVCKSEEKQKRESEAHIQNIIHGGKSADDINNAAKLLTGNDVNVQEEIKKSEPIALKPGTPPVQKKQGFFPAVEPVTENFHSIIKDLETHKIKVSDAYDKIMELDEVNKLSQIDEAKKVVLDNGSSDEVKSYIIGELKERLK